MKTLNMNSEDIDNRCISIYGENYKNEDLPSYYRKEIELFKAEQDGIDIDKSYGDSSFFNWKGGSLKHY